MSFEDFKETHKNDLEYQKRFDAWEKLKKYFSGEGDKNDEDCDDFNVAFENPNDFFFEDEEEWIDKKIKELVVGLNLIGLKTVFSCEGHFDNVHKEDEYTLKGSWHIPFVAFNLGVDFEYPYGKKEWQIKEEKEQKVIAKIQSLINEFYQDCKVLPEIKISLRKIEDRCHYDCIITTSELEDQGTESALGVQDHGEAERIAKEKLRKEQQEILRFSEFLKKKYLETGFHL